MQRVSLIDESGVKRYGKIIADGYTFVLVEFDEPIKGGHSGGRTGKDGHCFYVPRSKLTFYKSNRDYIRNLKK